MGETDEDVKCRRIQICQAFEVLQPVWSCKSLNRQTKQVIQRKCHVPTSVWDQDLKTLWQPEPQYLSSSDSADQIDGENLKPRTLGPSKERAHNRDHHKKMDCALHYTEHHWTSHAWDWNPQWSKKKRRHPTIIWCRMLDSGYPYFGWGEMRQWEKTKTGTVADVVQSLCSDQTQEEWLLHANCDANMYVVLAPSVKDVPL